MMSRTLVFFCFIAVMAGNAYGQAGAPTPGFEIADVHASPRSSVPNLVGPVVREGRYELRNATMVDLIRTAYRVDAEKVVGGPSWLEMDRFDVIAKVPPATSLEATRTMLKALLADRFTLVVHEDTRPFTAYALTVGAQKPKMKEAAGGGAPGCQGQAQAADPGAVQQQVVQCRNMTMAALAEQLPRMAGAYIANPVVDSTGLQGAWDFELRWTARALLQQAGADGISMFDAVDKQLGLKLELKEMPASALVVDAVAKVPSANPPGVAAILPPPPPPEFEVANIKPSQPGSPGPMARIQPTGQVNVAGMPLRTLLMLAWDVNSEELIDAPKWTESARFDVVARAFTATGSTDTLPIGIDALRAMVRALLIERFKMKTHVEERQVSAHTLTAISPKLVKADPASRTRCIEGPAPNTPDPRNRNPILSRLITCQNVTIAQFTERIQQTSAGYVRTPIADETGLEGGWNMSLNFSPVGVFQGGAGGRGGDAGPAPGGALAASEPNGALSLSEALERQLGLKLELKKRSMPVVVFDHIEETPTEN
jgi:uncharacterized protein (TIGR03435 family)